MTDARPAAPRSLPRLRPVNGRRLIDLDAANATAIRHDFRQFSHARAVMDAQAAGEAILKRITGATFRCTLIEDPS